MDAETRADICLTTRLVFKPGEHLRWTRNCIDKNTPLNWQIIGYTMTTATVRVGMYAFIGSALYNTITNLVS